LMADLFTGAQDYRSLKQRLWRQFGLTLTEIVSSLLKLRPSLAEGSAGGAEPAPGAPATGWPPDNTPQTSLRVADPDSFFFFGYSRRRLQHRLPRSTPHEG